MPHPPDKPKLKRINVETLPEKARTLKKLAIDRNTTVTAIVNALIDRFLADPDGVLPPAP